MLTRLKVKGFKSLEDVEVSFGPLTCVVGPNGAGKSNLLDAIYFLSQLADTTIADAVARVCQVGDSQASIASMFTRTASGQAQLIELEADLLVKKSVVDDDGRASLPKVTFLHYQLKLAHVPSSAAGPEGVRLIHEALEGIPKGDARARLGFPASKAFFDSVYAGSARGNFISMNADKPLAAGAPKGAHPGASGSTPIEAAERTVVGRSRTVDQATALAAKREMQSWSKLQFEPTALRESDAAGAPGRLSSSGKNLAATLHRLPVSDWIASQLSSLLPGVRRIGVDVDDGTGSKTLFVEMAGGVRLGPRDLPIGALRFLAVALLAADSEGDRLVCIEEPENGLHPARITGIVELLRGMAVDPGMAVDEDNPLRQVIITTHSPAIVRQFDADSLLIAQPYLRDQASLSAFCPLADSWRAKMTGRPESAKFAPTWAALLDYLGRDAQAAPGSGNAAALRKFQEHVDAGLK